MSEIKHIRLSCTGCGASLRVAAAHAGKYVNCPRCSQVSPIPTLEQCQTWASAQSKAPEPIVPEADNDAALELGDAAAEA